MYDIWIIATSTYIFVVALVLAKKKAEPPSEKNPGA